MTDRQKEAFKQLNNLASLPLEESKLQSKPNYSLSKANDLTLNPKLKIGSKAKRLEERKGLETKVDTSRKIAQRPLAIQQEEEQKAASHTSEEMVSKKRKLNFLSGYIDERGSFKRRLSNPDLTNPQLEYVQNEPHQQKEVGYLKKFYESEDINDKDLAIGEEQTA